MAAIAVGIAALSKYEDRIQQMLKEDPNVIPYQWRKNLGDLTGPSSGGRRGLENVRELLGSVLEAREENDEPFEGEIVEPPAEEWRRPRPTSIPELNYLPWRAVRGRDSQLEHYAIDIPLNEPTAADLAFDAQNGSKPLPLPAGGWESRLSPPDGPEQMLIPERIRINSIRLIDILKYELSKGYLPPQYGSSAVHLTCGPYQYLRPFKGLVYLENRIRHRLLDFEKALEEYARRNGKAYIEKCARQPADDVPINPGIPIEHRLDETAMTPPVLVGFIGDLRALIKFFDERLNPERKRLANDPKDVRYADLWFVFPAGSLIYVKDKGTPQKIWKIIQRTGGRRFLARPTSGKGAELDFEKIVTPFVIDCYYVDFDGERYVPVFEQFSITEFEETQPLASLPIIPFQTAERGGLVDKEALITRAHNFKECTKVSHRYYTGRTLVTDPTGFKLSNLELGNVKNVSRYSERVESEVIIDFGRTLQEIPSWKPGLDKLQLFRMEDKEVGNWAGFDQDFEWDRKISEEFLKGESAKWEAWEKLKAEPDGEDLLLLPARVFSFILRSRTWGKLFILKTARHPLTLLSMP